MTTRLIAAIDRERGIAKHGYQPWYIPHDEQYFTNETKRFGGYGIYGTRTFELSLLKKPLEGRHNYLLTYDKKLVKGVEIVNDLEKFVENFQHDLWVIGGANVFEQFVKLGWADELYLTHIEADFGCDQFFPEYEKGFKLSERSDTHKENGFTYNFSVYVKK